MQLYSDVSTANPLLSRAEEVELFERLAGGDESARDRLVLSNLGLVRKFAIPYSGVVPLEDLMHEGVFGLLHAIEKFDVSKGFKFSTYAIWWVRQHVQRAADTMGRPVRIPEYISRKKRHMEYAEVEFFQREDRWPTVEELAGELGVSADSIDECELASARGKHALSIDSPSSHGQGFTIGDLIEDEGALCAVDEIVDDMEVNQVLSCLTVEEQVSLKERLGISESGRRVSAREMGKRYNITYEGYRKREEKQVAQVRKAYVDLYGSSAVERVV